MTMLQWVKGSEYRKPGAPLYTLIDLFAGCGGLSLGFEYAGFTPVFVNEIDTDAMKTYLTNRQHNLGGERFSDNEALHSYDVHDMRGNRLKALLSDLNDIPELDFVAPNQSRVSAGGGSTLDVVVGGPPCQGYSGIGIRRSYSVDRTKVPSNYLFQRMALILRRLRPRIFLFENVRGVLNAKWMEGGLSIWDEIVHSFRSVPGYEVRWSLVFARNYGVPQNRPRVLLVGLRKDILDSCHSVDSTLDPMDALACGFLPRGEEGLFPHLEDLLGDLVDPKVTDSLRTGNLPSGPFETTSYPKRAQNVIQSCLRTPPPWDTRKRVQLTEQEYSKHKPRVVEKFDHMLANNGEIPARFATKKFSQRVLPANWGNREPYITATSLPDDYIHYCAPRTLTVREWARLQQFPDWYKFSGKRTTGGIRRAGNPRQGIFEREVPKYTQIGNAVPVGLAHSVGSHFKKILDESLGLR